MLGAPTPRTALPTLSGALDRGGGITGLAGHDLAFLPGVAAKRPGQPAPPHCTSRAWGSRWAVSEVEAGGTYQRDPQTH